MSKKLKITILSIVSLILISAIIFICCTFSIFTITGNSMEPTLHDGDKCIVSKIYDLDRFDVMIFRFNDVLYAKRVIGLPNETIEYRDNKLYVNGELIEDTYGSGSTNDFIVTLKDDEFYCLGDNREQSLDSRRLGAFKLGYIVAEIRK